MTIDYNVVKILSAPEHSIFGNEWVLRVEVEHNNGGKSIKNIFFDNYEECELYVNDFNGEFEDE